MYKVSEARQQHDQSKDKKESLMCHRNVGTLWFIKPSDFNIYEFYNSNLYNEVQCSRHQRDEQGARGNNMRARVCDSQSKHTARHDASWQHRNESSQSSFTHTRHTIDESQLKPNKKMEKVAKVSATKCSRKMKNITSSFKKTTSSISFSRDNREQLLKLRCIPKKLFERKKECQFCGECEGLISMATSSSYSLISITSISTLSSSLSSRCSIELGQWVKHCEGSSVNCVATKPPLKCVSQLNSKHFPNSELPNKYHVKRNTYECPLVFLDLNCPSRCNSSDIINKVKEDKKRTSLSSFIIVSALSIATAKKNQNRLRARARKRTSTIHVTTYESKLDLCNVSNERLLNMNIPKHKLQNSKKNGVQPSQFSLFTYFKYFTQNYHTYFADLHYHNGALQLSQASRQAVGIGSICDFSIDFGRSTIPDYSVHGEPTSLPNKDDDIASSSNTGVSKKQSLGKTKRHPFECSPGVCVPGKCDPNECFKQLKKTAPYGSHVSTQSAKFKVDGQIPIKDIQGKTLKSVKKPQNKTSRKEKFITEAQRNTKRRRGRNNLAQPSHRRVTRIRSKLSFNVQFYKDTPLGSQQSINKRKKKISADTTVRQKAGPEKKVQALKPFECEPGVCVRSKCDPKECYRRIKVQALKQFECEPGICVPGKCDPKECYRKIKVSHAGSGTDGFLTPSSQSSHAKTQSPKLKIDKQEVIGAKTRTQHDNLTPVTQKVPHQRVTRIASKTSFNIQFYKDVPLDSRQLVNRQQREITAETTVRQKAVSKKNKTLKKIECEPGVCVPGKCDPKECYQRIKSSAGTDASLAASSYGTSHSSQASTQSHKYKKRELRAGKETFYKEKGVSSVPRHKPMLHIPNRQAVRIGSKCSFNIEFYKATPQNLDISHGYPLQRRSINEVQPKQKEITVTSSSNKKQEKKNLLKQIKCEPGVCIPGKCIPIECYERIKAKQITTGTDTSVTASSNATTHGSQATKTRKNKRRLKSEQANLHKDKSASTKSTLKSPNRQAVRIGSKCSFNVEFYKTMPQNSFKMNAQNNQHAIVLETNRSPVQPKVRKKNVALNQFQCEPGVCVPSQCNPNECFLRLKANHEGTNDASWTSSSNSSTTHKRRVKRTGKAMIYKDKGASSMRTPKMQLTDLYTPKENTVRIGSTCSFNIEFYKSTPPNAFLFGEQNTQPANIITKPIKKKQLARGRYDQGDTTVLYRKKRKPFKAKKKSQRQYEQGDFGMAGGPPTQSSIMRQFVCDPGVCNPKKCDPNECFRRLRIQQMKNRGLEQFVCEPGVCIPGKCDPNECFAKLSPNIHQMKGKMRNKALKQFVCDPGVCIPKKCDPNECFRRLKIQQMRSEMSNKGLKQFVCEPGVCIPEKCDPNECFARLIKIRHEGTSTDASLRTSSNSYDSQTSTQTKKEKKANQRKRAGKETFYKDRAASTLPRAKMPLHVPNRQIVRIGSKCSFNLEFYKDGVQNRFKDLNGKQVGFRQFPETNDGQLKQIECEPGICVPGTCDPYDCYKRITGTPWAQQPQIDSGDTIKKAVTGSDRRRRRSEKQTADTGKDQRISKSKRRQKPDTDKDKPETGKAKSITGEDKSITGKDKSITDKDKSITGKDKSITGKGRSVTGKDKSITGKDKSITGKDKPKAGKDKPDAGKDKPNAGKDKPISASSKREKAEAEKYKISAGENEKIIEKKSKVKKEKIKKVKQSPKQKDQDDVNVEDKAVTAKQAIKTKKSKEKPKQVKQPPERGDPGNTEVQQKASSQKKSKPQKEKLKQSKQSLGQSEQGDNEVGKQEGTSTEISIPTKPSAASHNTEVATQSKVVAVERPKKADRQKKTEKEPGYKEQSSETFINTKNIKDNPLPIPIRYPKVAKKEVVRIGSRCSINIQFFKERSRPGSPQRGIITSKPLEVQTNKGIVSFLRKCCCKFSGKENHVAISQAPMLFQQGPANQQLIVAGKNNTMQNQMLQPLECIPGTCVVGKCDPDDCYRRLKPRDLSLNTSRLQSFGPGKPSKKFKRYECRFGICFPNRNNRNEYRERTEIFKGNVVDTGTDTSPRAKPTAVTYGTNAATQSRGFPGQLGGRIDKPLICKCAAARLRREAGRTRYGDCLLFGPNLGYAGIKGRIKEQAVILGSGCGFNIKYFRKKKKK